ncbi:MAG TPA: hypothetical protein VNL72_00945 [Gammaproteobacteria bacterium]|nr:hypothetical protein [Gammaproteobacteria bacterium]
MLRYLLIGLVAAVLYALYRLLVKRPAAGGDGIRREIESYGVEVRQVMRSLPVVAVGGRSYRLVDGKCVLYRLPNHVPGAPRWQLLQRAGTEHPPFPPGWQFVLLSGEPGGRLQDVLLRIAREWGGEYLELEGDGEAIYAYWQESGGPHAAWRVHDYLKALAEAVRG